MTRKIVETVFERARVENDILVIETPPGTGKTSNTALAVYELASRGYTVVFAVPTHSAGLTTLTYILHRATEEKTPKPYVVYYEGVARYCPLLTDNELFHEAVKKAAEDGLIPKNLAERMLRLSVQDVIRIYSTTFICMKICPLKSIKPSFTTEKIFVTKKVFDRLISEASRSGSELVDKLLELQKKKLLFVASPVLVGKKPQGYCIRHVLLRPLNPKEKRLLVGRGAVIITPESALFFVLQAVMRWRRLIAKKRPVPKIIVVIDEYDSFIQKPNTSSLVSLEIMKKEFEEAKQVHMTELEKYRKSDPSFDPDLFLATLYVAFIYRDVERWSRSTRKPGNTPLSFLAEFAVNPCDGVAERLEPLTPREIFIPVNIRELFSKVKERARKYIEDTLGEEGLEDFKQKLRESISKYLAYWETYLAQSHEKWYAPVLYRTADGRYKLGLAYTTKIRSHIRLFVRLIGTRAYPKTEKIWALPVAYSLGKYGMAEIVDINRQAPALQVKILLLDPKLLILNEGDIIPVLLSATGLPWTTWYLTMTSRSGRPLSYVLGKVNLVQKRDLLDYSMYVFKIGIKRRIVLLSLSKRDMYEYAKLALVIGNPEHKFIPPRKKTPDYYEKLEEALLPYLSTLHEVIAKTPSGYAVFVITQRKELTGRIVAWIKNVYRGKVYYCFKNYCSERRIKDLSHVRILLPGKKIVYVTWFRSRMARGVDVAEKILYVVVVGSPYPPPMRYDIAESVSEASTVIAIPIAIATKAGTRIIHLVHYHLDILSAVSELVQVVGRAMRKAWSTALRRGMIEYRVAIVVPEFLVQKLYQYSPLWFKEVMIRSI